MPKYLIIQLAKLQCDIFNLNTIFDYAKEIPITSGQGYTVILYTPQNKFSNIWASWATRNKY